jgi:hypothetical protein
VLVPLHGFLRGDTVGLLLLVQDTDTLARVARIMVDAAAVRVAPAAHVRVFRAGIELALTETVAGAGLIALERIDLVADEPDVQSVPATARAGEVTG